MQICVAGWYYLEECLIPLSKLNNVYIVAHRLGDNLNIPCTIIENIGLEFHCYDYFVKNIWDKKNDVLFCHDDIKIKDISFVEDVKKIDEDIIMVWHDEHHFKKNLAHGRIFKCSEKYLTKSGGFWYDINNKGCIKASEGCNTAISKLYMQTKDIITNFYTQKVVIGFRGIVKE
jgi:hypothetical protein